MKNKTFFISLLLFISINFSGCKSSAPNNTPATVEEAEKQLAEKDKRNARAAKKSRRKSQKRYWKGQSKSAKKSVRKNLRFQKRKARKMRRNK